MRVLPHTVLGAEVILESYAEVYSNQFTTGNSPLQLVQWSTVPNNNNNNKIRIWYPSLITRNSSRDRQPLSRVNVTELLCRLLVKIENIYLFKTIIIIKNMETSLKTGFAQIFSCCPKNLSCPNFGGAAAPLAPRPVRLCWKISKIKQSLVEWGCRATSLTLLTGKIKDSHAATVKKSYKKNKYYWN